MPFPTLSISITSRLGHEPFGYVESSGLSNQVPTNGSVGTEAIALASMSITVATPNLVFMVPSRMVFVMKPLMRGLERSQKIKYGLFVFFRQRVEPFHHRVRFGRPKSVRAKILSGIVAAIGEASREVILNRDHQVASSSVVQEEQALAQSPQRSSAEFIWPSRPLHDVVGQACAHVVNQKIRKQIHGLPTQCDGVWPDLLQRARGIWSSQCLE